MLTVRQIKQLRSSGEHLLGQRWVLDFLWKGRCALLVGVAELALRVALVDGHCLGLLQVAVLEVTGFP